MSKKIRLFLASLLVIAVAIFFYFNNQDQQTLSDDFSTFSALKLPKLKNATDGQVKNSIDFSAPESANEMVDDLASNLADKKCQEMAVNIHDTDLSALSSSYNRYFANGHCLARDPKKVEQLKKLLDKLCNDKDKKTAAFSKLGCQNILLSMKQKLMELFTSQAEVKSLDDNSLNYEFVRLVKAFNDPSKMAESLGRMKEVSEEMYSRNPEDVAVIQSLVLSNIYSSSEVSDEDYDRYQTILEKKIAKSENPGEVRRLEKTSTILDLKKENFSKVKEESEKKLSKNPQDIEARYHLSLAQYRLGNKDASLNELDEILKIAKDHPHYKEVKRRVEQSDPNNPDEKPFTIHSNIPMNLK